MTIKNHRTLLLLAASITLAGCQTTTTTPFKDATQYENIVTIKAEIDSDGDGVPDELDMCPATPENVVVDDRGCPFTMPGVGLKMEYRAFFDKDSSELLPKYQAELDKVGMKLQEYKTATILIEGHNSRTEVDSVSIDQANALAQDRANKVKDYLISKYNIAPERLTATEYGARRLITSSDSEEGNMLNRRVYAIASEPEE
ncbi:OmpA family protein [Psychrobacter frigidicola]|uniref:OmpA family protein n=1 Tax=Psychrobacter frigidicola TaxID=45611 RepID=A0A5C7A6L4_9GAMM|nr:OmpA family protein [Psychrobacter frigidicola]TXD97466.1 OmpA family protein [Psychrobacter frigidicola]